MKNYVIYFIIVFGVMSCGTRKVQTEINKQSDKEQQTEKVTEKSEDKEQSKSSKTDETKNDISQKDVTETTITEFNENGTPKKQTVTKKTSDKFDKSSNKKSETFDYWHTRTKSLEIGKTRTIIKEVYQKSKFSWANNWGWPVFGIVAALGVLVWLWFKFKK